MYAHFRTVSPRNSRYSSVTFDYQKNVGLIDEAVLQRFVQAFQYNNSTDATN